MARSASSGPTPGPHWQEGLQVALSRLPELSPPVAASRSGCSYERGVFTVPFLDRVFHLSFPSGEATEKGTGQPPPPWLHLILLHYLLTADGTPVADSWITYRYLPGAFLFEGRFQEMAITSLARAFAQDLEGFRRAGLALRGDTMSRTGDAGFRFLVLPRLPMAAILYLGDEEVPGSAAVLFDSSAPHYLPTEDLSIVGSYLSRQLLARRGG